MTDPSQVSQIVWANLQRLAEKANQIPPPDDYTLRCESAVWFRTKQHNKPAIKAQYSVASGPCQGMSVWVNQTLTESSAVAVSIFISFLEAHGVDPSQVASNDQITKLMVGRFVDATIEHEEYQGRTMPRPKNFRASDGSIGSAQPQPQQMQVQQQQPQQMQPQQQQAPVQQMQPQQQQAPAEVQQIAPAQVQQVPVEQVQQQQAPAEVQQQQPVVQQQAPPVAEGYLAGVPSVFDQQQQQQQ